MNFRLFIFVFCVLFLNSCRTMDYRIRAVDKAREFAMERQELKSLSQTQRDYIRYAPPVLMDHTILTSSTSSKNDLVQTCVVWSDVPGLDYDIVISGVAERRLQYWTPQWLILKKFIPVNEKFKDAVIVAREYVMNRMLYLSDADRNYVRFNRPEYYGTDFALDDELLEKFMKQRQNVNERAEANAKARGEEFKKEELRQISFVWKPSPKGKNIVVTGMGKDNLELWQAIKGQWLNNDELDEHLNAKKKDTKQTDDAKKGKQVK